MSYMLLMLTQKNRVWWWCSRSKPSHYQYLACKALNVFQFNIITDIFTHTCTLNQTR